MCNTIATQRKSKIKKKKSLDILRAYDNNNNYNKNDNIIIIKIITIKSANSILRINAFVALKTVYRLLKNALK